MILWLVGCTMTGGEGGDGRRLGAALLGPTTPTGGTPSTPAPEPQASDTGAAVFTGGWSIASVDMVQDGPWIDFVVMLDQPVSLDDVHVSATFYFSGKEMAGWVDVVNGVATFSGAMVDACTYLAWDVDYITVTVAQDQAFLGLLELDAQLVWDIFATVYVGEGEADYVVLCGGTGTWPDPWVFTTRFPGGAFELGGRGTLRHADGTTVVLTDDFEVRDLKVGTWTWEQDPAYANPRHIYYVP